MARETKQGDIVRRIIADATHPLLATEIHHLAQQLLPRIGLATVYRNLRQMLETGDAQLVTLPGETPRYESSNRPHHHHFLCGACQRVFDIDACPGSFDPLLPEGFSLSAHDLTLYGQCRDCHQQA